MILSIFIRDKEFHISTEAYGEVHKVTETRGMADKIPALFSEFLNKIEFNIIDTIVYSTGSASFTTTRIVNSLVKGIKVARPDIKFIGVSNFLTYIQVLKYTRPSGTIAIPTMRGDYYICEYVRGKIAKTYISEELYKETIMDSAIGLDNVNLASLQIKAIHSELVDNNDKYIINNLETKYTYNPEYVHKED